MLDTRKISDFLRPERIIIAVNKFSKESALRFSDWRPADKSFVISKLLEEHIGLVCAKRESIDKLTGIARKVGYPIGTKLLILSDEFNPGFHLIEVVSATQFLYAFGHFEDETKISGSLMIELNPEGAKPPFSFSNSTIDSETFQKRVEKHKLDEDFQRAFLFMCIGAANIFTYLIFVEVETVDVAPGKKFESKRYESFINKQSATIKVADLGWSRESINSIPFGVVGHFREQPYGPGRTNRRLMYINPYFKAGYNRKSGKEKILGEK